jgi:hypothetical protein
MAFLARCALTLALGVGPLTVAAQDAAAPAAPAAPEIPAWFDAGASTTANAEKAKAANAAPAAATETIIRLGDSAPATVAAVVAAYKTCDAVTQSVRSAVEAAPAEAQAIVDAALGVAECPCSDAQVWERSRMDRRIRVQTRKEPVGLAPGCDCAASVAGAVAAAIGGAAYGLVEKTLTEQARCECSAAAFAAVANAVTTDSQVWIRDQSRALTAEAAAGGAVLDLIGEVGPPEERRGALDALAQPLVRAELSCAATEGQDARFLRVCTWANRFPLLIARYVTDAGGRRGVELVNVGKEPIDLAAEHLALDIVADGERRPRASIPLAGRLEPNARFVVATPTPPAGLPAPNATHEALGGRGLDAVVLRRTQPDNAATAACHASALALVATEPEVPIVIGAAPTTPVEGEPRTDESPIDPNRGGDIASPN